MKKSVVIIGAGFSGLSAAAFMGKAGWDVTVIEKNDTAGGRAKQLKSNGFTFDMGPSWYWMPDVFENFFKSFGKKVSDYYSLKRLDPSYRIYWNDGYNDIPAQYPQVKNLFNSLEKHGGERLDQFMEEAQIKYDIGIGALVYKPGLSIKEFMDWKVIKNFFKLDVFKSIKEHISKYFKNERLKQILEFPVLFLGALPSDTPALYSLMNYADVKGGTWYPDKGLYSVIQAMESIGIDNGVKFHFNENAIDIIVENGIAKKLKTNKGEYKADVFISSADYVFTEMHLLPEKYRSYSMKYWNKRTMAPSCLLYYIGINKKLENVLHHSLFFDTSFMDHGDDIYKSLQWPREPLFYVNAPSVTDDSVAPQGCENMMLLIPIASGLSGDDEKLREYYFNKIINRLEKHTGQSIANSIIFKKTYSISNFKEDYNSFKGNAYGLANTLRQTALFKPSCQSRKVRNLFFAGQLTVPGPGVPPCIISGEIVSKLITQKFK
ncbi:MAG: phytoene desaturase family protein [Flavisolibacter sp.]